MTEGGPPGRRRASPSISHPFGRSTQQARADCRAMVASSVSPGRSRTMFSKPLAYPSTLDRRPRLRTSAAVAVLRGGALEPEPHRLLGKAQAKADAYFQRVLHARSAEGLSLSGGASIQSRAYS